MSLSYEQYETLEATVQRLRDRGKWNDTLEQEYQKTKDHLFQTQPELMTQQIMRQVFPNTDMTVESGPVLSPEQRLTPDQVQQGMAARQAAMDRLHADSDFQDVNRQIRENVARIRQLSQRTNEAVAAAEQQSKEPIVNFPVVREVVQGLAASGHITNALIARTLGRQREADSFTQLAAEAQQAAGDNIVSQSAAGAVSSLATVVQGTAAASVIAPTSAVATPLIVGAAFVAQSMNQAAETGRSRGLSGPQLGAYVAGQGAIEGAVTAAFQRMGLGGLESSLVPVIKQGVTDALKQFAIQTGGELSEEVIITALSKVWDYAHDLSPTVIPTPEEVTGIVLQTLMSMGAAKALRASSDTRGRAADTRAPSDAIVQAEKTLATEQGKLATADQKLAEAKQVASTTPAVPPVGVMEASPPQVVAVEPVAPAKPPVRMPWENKPPGPPPVFVNQSEVSTPDQRTAVSPAKQQETAAREAEARSSPQSPESVRRDPRRSDAVSEEADQLVGEMRVAGKVTQDMETRIRGLVDEARRNPVTGGMNRNALGRVWDALRQRSRANKRPISVIAFDAANLKSVNDKLGETAGDDYLRSVQEAMENATRTSLPDRSRVGDIFHYGGDEWVVVLPDTDAAGAQIVRDRIEQAFGKRPIVEGVSAFLVGDTVTIQPSDKREWRAIVTDASDRMKTRKNAAKRASGEAVTRAEAEAKVQGKPAAAAPPDNLPVRPWEAVKQAFRDRQAQAAVVEEARRQLAIAKGQQYAAIDRAKAAITASPKTPRRRFIPRQLDDLIAPIGTRLQQLSPRLFGRLMEMQYRTDSTTERLKKEFLGHSQRLHRAVAKAGQDTPFKLALLNQEHDNARAIINAIDSTLLTDFDQCVTLFQTLHTNLTAAGLDMGHLENYWPRVVSDYEGLRHEIGADQGLFEDAWADAEKAKGTELTREEKTDVANSVLQGFGPRKVGSASYGLAHARRRSERPVTAATAKYYRDPFDAMFVYIDSAVYTVERMRFLGQAASTPDAILESAGRVVQNEVDAGQLNRQDQALVRDLLTARFSADLLRPAKWSRVYRSAVHLLTLGQIRSAITQIEDIGITIADHGLMNTGRGLVAALRMTPREKRLVMEDIGVHAYGEEYRDNGRLARTVDRTLTATGFKALDRLGKESRMNAALSHFARIAANPMSREFTQFEREYRKVLGDDAFNRVLVDLRRGLQSEDVKLLAFLDISKIQPVSLNQMPAAYLRNPNGRIVYTLKTFIITQLDHMRRAMAQKILTPGQRVEGLKHLGRYVLFRSLLGLGADWIKDWIAGKLTGPEDIGDRTVNRLLQIVGLNRYLVDRAWTSPSTALLSFVAPPIPMVDAVARDVFGKGDPDKPGLRTLRFTPVIGELYYHHWGRGWYENRENAKRDYRKRLRQVRESAMLAYQEGDIAEAENLLRVYNDRRRHGPGDGRSRPLTFRDLRLKSREDSDE